MRKFLKRSIARLLACIMLVSGILLMPNKVSAADETVSTDMGVVYVQYTDETEVKDTYFGKTAPTYSSTVEVCGYLFGGWFEKIDESTFRPIKDEAALETVKNYYAKFVPAYVLGVKCQNMHDANEDSPNTNLRFVSGVDSTNYAEIGFVVRAVSLYDSNDLKGIKLVGETGPEEVSKVYEKLYVYNGPDTEEGVKYTPKQVLGEAANYFMTYRLDNIASKNFDKAWSIQPYWKTFDGVKVYGLTKYAHIEDGLCGYINIPVNLKRSEGVAAGRLEIDWSALNPNGSTAYEFMEAECGMVFDKKVIQEQNDNTIRCIAYSSSTGDKSSDNIYINLRFEPVGETKAKSYNRNFYNFSVSQTQFANYDEVVLSDYTVWDVQY